MIPHGIFTVCDAKNNTQPFSATSANHFLPVDFYIGGIEHACLHLLYARFFTKALRIFLYNITEPFNQLICQGMFQKIKKCQNHWETPSIQTIIGNMALIQRGYSFYLCLGKDLEWSDEGVEGSFRFLKRLFNTTVNYKSHPIEDKNIPILKKHTHKVIKKITDDINNFQFNTAISQLMELINTISKTGTNLETALIMARLIAPFAPFIAETIWQELNQSSVCSTLANI